MSENISRQYEVVKPALSSPNGMVSAQNQVAADVGARVLREGGNAIDAAISTAFALAATEFWNSGIGGGGFMIVHQAKPNRTSVIDFGMVAASRLSAEDYPLVEGKAGDLFGWPAVAGNRNQKGYGSIAVPGQVDGMALALAEFGSWSWAKVLGPAIELAERGVLADWFTTLQISGSAADLSEFPASRAAFLPNGFPPVMDWVGTPIRVAVQNFSKTLRRLADAGARDFYEGALADAIADDLEAGGSPIRRDDLARYRSRLVEPLSFDHGAARLHVAGGLTAGPSLRAALAHIGGQTNGRRPDDASFRLYAQALIKVSRERLSSMGDGDSPSCTTNLCVVDREGNMVALTQTLLGLFGSKVTLPQTGIVMNNGIMWFDPRPGKPNSIAPGKRPLSNMCPVIGTRDGTPWFAVGASGGRRILPAVLQMVSFLVDHDMNLDEAMRQPRIDVSEEDQVVLDQLLPDATVSALRREFGAKTAPRGFRPLYFACPTGVLRDASGLCWGASESTVPWASASGA